MKITPWTRLMLISHHKATRLEADLDRMADVLSLIVTLAEDRPALLSDAQLFAQIARLGRAGLAGATPPSESQARETA
jgi:hypothetical protein